MARPEVKPRTPIAARLRAIRKAMHGDDRDLFSQWLGISKSSIAHYERGERTPDAGVLVKYHQRFSVDINWLLTGNGEMLAKPAVSAARIDAHLLERLAGIVTSALNALSLRLTPEGVAAESAALYNDLATRVGLDDAEAVEATLPIVQLTLRRRLAEAAAAAGSGK